MEAAAIYRLRAHCPAEQWQLHGGPRGQFENARVSRRGELGHKVDLSVILDRAVVIFVVQLDPVDEGN